MISLQNFYGRYSVYDCINKSTDLKMRKKENQIAQNNVETLLRFYFFKINYSPLLRPSCLRPHSVFQAVKADRISQEDWSRLWRAMHCRSNNRSPPIIESYTLIRFLQKFIQDPRDIHYTHIFWCYNIFSMHDEYTQGG